MIMLGLAAMPGMALAQAAQSAGQFNVPYGKSYNDFNQPFDARTRDSNGNRTIVNGRMFLGSQSNLSLGLGGSFFGSGNFGTSGVGGLGGAGAIGNQLNVVTLGSWNTVIIDSTQINNGDQTVNLNGGTQNILPFEPPIVADGPFVAAANSATQQWQPVAGAGSAREELNGDIQLND
ncbi:MAG: holdfast anchoring protein HfaA [Robiginitomaculum sp.]|nr:holdfast anchoring protein HfaA [Robiginitomaculum sp.]MDQ7076802.1 holdfast anchoring protein HfaA [Robiginitomaculum sp.]